MLRALAKLIGRQFRIDRPDQQHDLRINVVAQGFDFRQSGDEVLHVDGDFPATVFRL